MNRDELFAFALETFGTTPDYPWAKWPDYAVLRHQASRKWFGVVMNVDSEKLDVDAAGELQILNVKVDPDDALALRQMDGILPAYHMSKGNWVSILLDADIPKSMIEDLLARSFELTRPRQRARTPREQ